MARLSGVAESTVSRALNDSPLITDSIKEKVRAAAAELGYIPSRQAQLFARKKTCIMGFVVPEYGSFPPFSRPYFPALLDGAVLGADERGYSVSIVLNKVSTPIKDYFALVESKTVDGLIFAVTPADYRPFLELVEVGLPFVLINNYHEGLSSVDSLPMPGMAKAFSHAFNLGHRDIGYVSGDMRYRDAMDRLEAFKTLARDYGVRSRIVEGDFSRSSGYRAAVRFLGEADRPTLVMTSSDRQALGVLSYCSEKGLVVPRDLSLIGYDNLYPAQDLLPALSTVDHPISRSGHLGALLLADLIEGKEQGPVQKWLDTDFVVRESTGACPGLGAGRP